MTSNGVRAALRHAAEASTLILNAGTGKSLPRLPRAMYTFRVMSLARFFNSTIEKVLYDWPIRNRICPFKAGDVYTIPAWTMNLVYTRLAPQGLFATALFTGFLGVLRIGIDIFDWFCRRSAVPSSQASAVS